MNEFLKNLRSGKSQPQSAGRKNYEFHSGNERRAGSDRRSASQRKSQAQSKQGKTSKMSGTDSLVNEVLPNIQTLLESLAESSRSLALARERRAEAEERKADILEGLVGSFRDFLESDTLKQFAEGGFRSSRSLGDVKPQAPKKIPPDERNRIVKLIQSMRNNGSTYDQIAGYLDEQHIPTFSNKGRWHAQTIHRICQKK